MTIFSNFGCLGATADTEYVTILRLGLNFARLQVACPLLLLEYIYKPLVMETHTNRAAEDEDGDEQSRQENHTKHDEEQLKVKGVVLKVNVDSSVRTVC